MTTVDRRPGLQDSSATIAPVYAERRGRPGAMVELLAFRLDVDADAVAAAATLLSKEERERADRFAQERDRRRYTVARACLRRLLSERLDVHPASVVFRYGVYGKPEVGPEHGRPDLRFNLSHSEEVVVLALAIGNEVGVDLERIHEMPNIDRLAADHFSPQENAALGAVDASQRLVAFFNCWTRKEAFVKALGSGLGYPLDSFDVSLTPAEPARILRLSAEHGDPADWHMESFAPAPDFVAAVVVEAKSN